MSKEQIEGPKYRFDVDAMMRFVFDGVRDVSTEITESIAQTAGESSNSKIVRETKNDVNISVATIKYDLLKVFIGTLLDTDLTENEKPISFGETLTINTLLDNGIITEMIEKK